MSCLYRSAPRRLVHCVLALGLVLLTSLAPHAQAQAAGKKRIALMAGRASHGYGSHEHYAGCMLLAKSLQLHVPQAEVVVLKDGWPADPTALDGVDCLVMYCDGGGGHPVNQHLEQVEQLASRGAGVVCIHYGVEVPKGAPGDKFLDWIGGYFETHWSVNPHWTASFEKFPDHPITRGVRPFSINDEWYYHMRFRPEMQGVTPILTAIPPASTLERPDGPHSGNPDVRKTAGQPQHVAWAAERPNGGRGFGFTGGHNHWNWADDNFRRVVLNAIVWCSHLEVPQGGVGDSRPSLEELEANQDEPQPANFNRGDIQQRFELKSGGKPDGAAAAPAAGTGKPVWKSPVIDARTPGHSVPVDVEIKGAKELYLVVDDGGNGYGCDWADWAEPRLVGPAGEKRLTELKWKQASADFGQAQVGKNVTGGPLRIDGKPVEYGIGTHAKSVIAFDLPEGYERFQARVGLDNGGTDQAACGGQASVQFLVFTQRPAPSAIAASATAGSHDPQDAIAGLDVHEGLEATLFASEPRLLSLTNLDIDARGRVWVCEVVNYRRHNGQRAEGDRILILEDTDGDGRADTSKVFYQGRDIDSAMGICVLGNRVIVSASPHVLVFTDEDGDDKPDRKEPLFTNTGQPQHDHSAHSFLFGPDGMLYWNFGNTGKEVHDREGRPVVDRYGRTVLDNGKPYFGGMPFRCALDGSQFEVLAHNFRNNYEVTVDSFGTLWQSDNDDDGNRGVRINYVMEHGNFGYLEEGTGRGWREPRTNLESEIPLQHWHLNDPGVVPNLLQTGAGSPTGICVYEGRLLPKVFWDQVLHCDAGPNVVRAYPATPDGAGYKAEMVNLVHGARDNWFRPADVCVAPDGSVFVTDWYDPGVGGHAMGDLDRGRLFRIAPPGSAYKPPKIDVSTIEGAIEALQNPAVAVRALAWLALSERGAAAEPALEKLLSHENPRMRARAYWLLAKIPGRAATYVERAAAEQDPNLRVLAVRLARQTLDNIIPTLQRLAADENPQVRRECALALFHLESAEAPAIWATLAQRHDGQDRWYLEALGIGAEGRWDACLAAWRELVSSSWNEPAGRDIVWRSRAAATPALLVELIRQTKSPGEAARYLRAFDFLSGDGRHEALLELAFANGLQEELHDFVAVEAVRRLGNVDVRGNVDHAKALETLLQRSRGGDLFVELVGKFGLEDHYTELVKVATGAPESSLGVAAATVLLEKQQQPLLRTALRGEPREAAAFAIALGNTADGRAVGALAPVALDNDADLEVRRQATRAMARSRNGATRLLELARQEKLPEALKTAAAGPLSALNIPELRDEALRLFPQPEAKGSEAVPPISELVKRGGNAGKGAELFRTTGQCANCHVVAGQGKEVGPNLTEIGGKLSRHALFESILFPSAGIAHNYENYLVELESGDVANGVLLSRTDQELVIRTDKAITRTIPASEVARVRRLENSLMPADLQKQLSVQDLTDIVDYLGTLKAAPK